MTEHSITKGMILFKWAWVLFMIGATSAPYLVNFLLTPEGYQYTWVLPPYPEDPLAYMAWSQQAVNGNLLFKIKYTALPHAAFLLHPVFLLFGFISSLTGLDIRIVHFVMRVVGVIFFWVVFYKYIAYLKFDHFSSVASTIMVGISSGFGWLVRYLGVYSESPDIWIPGMNTYYSFLWNPLYPYSLALIILVVFLLDRGTSSLKPMYVWLSGLIVGFLAFIHPYNIPLLLTMGTVIVVIRLRSRAAGFVLRFLLSSLPLVLIPFLISKLHPLASLHGIHGSMSSPPLWAYLFGFGLPLVFAGTGILLERLSFVRKYHILFLWAAIGIFFCYAPSWFQRSCIFSLHVPICLLAGLSLGIVKSKLMQARAGIWVLSSSLVVLFPLLVSTQIFILIQEREEVRANINGHYYVSESLMNGMRYLRENSSPNDIVFASMSTSTLIPVFSGNTVIQGHWAMSVDIKERLDWLNSIATQKSGEYTHRQFHELGIKYLFIDGVNKQLLTAEDPSWLVAGARKVFENDDVIIFHEENEVGSVPSYREALRKGDYAGALKELEQLARKGDVDAQENLGLMYAKGKGVQADLVQAERWIRKAAERGLPEAQYNLGLMQVRGQGVPQNNAEALKWFKKSSEQGYTGAQYCLGVMYLQGLGVPRDLMQAYMWWLLAESGGSKDAARAINAVKGQLTPAQISEAQKRSKNLKQGG